MSDALNRLAAVVGDKHAIRDAAQMDGYMREWRQIWTGRSPLVLRPGSTEEVSRLLAIANETRTAIVPQAGNTGLCGGQIPTDAGDEVVLSLDDGAQLVLPAPQRSTQLSTPGEAPAAAAYHAPSCWGAGSRAASPSR